MPKRQVWEISVNIYKNNRPTPRAATNPPAWTLDPELEVACNGWPDVVAVPLVCAPRLKLVWAGLLPTAAGAVVNVDMPVAAAPLPPLGPPRLTVNVGCVAFDPAPAATIPPPDEPPPLELEAAPAVGWLPPEPRLMETTAGMPPALALPLLPLPVELDEAAPAVGRLPPEPRLMETTVGMPPALALPLLPPPLELEAAPAVGWLPPEPRLMETTAGIPPELALPPLLVAAAAAAPVPVTVLQGSDGAAPLKLSAAPMLPWPPRPMDTTDPAGAGAEVPELLDSLVADSTSPGPVVELEAVASTEVVGGAPSATMLCQSPLMSLYL
jgi:hypothetical protein